MQRILEDTTRLMLRSRDKLHHARLLGVVPSPARWRGARRKPRRCPLKVDSQALHILCEGGIPLHSLQEVLVRLLEMCAARDAGIRRWAQPGFVGHAVKLPRWFGNPGDYSLCSNKIIRSEQNSPRTQRMTARCYPFDLHHLD